VFITRIDKFICITYCLSISVDSAHVILISKKYNRKTSSRSFKLGPPHILFVLINKLDNANGMETIGNEKAPLQK